MKIISVSVTVSHKIPGPQQYESFGAEVSLTADLVARDDVQEVLDKMWDVAHQNVNRQLPANYLPDELLDDSYMEEHHAKPQG